MSEGNGSIIGLLRERLARIEENTADIRKDIADLRQEVSASKELMTNFNIERCREHKHRIGRLELSLIIIGAAAAGAMSPLRSYMISLFAKLL